MEPAGRDRRRRNGGPALTLARVLVLALAALVAYRIVAHVGGQGGTAAGRQGAALSATDATGRLVELQGPPQRIVSLTPANTEILFALGLGPRVVADTAYCDFPPAAQSLPHVGDSAISVEKVIAQRPDLVVASASANAKVIGPLQRAGVHVFAVDPRNFVQTLTAIADIGKLTGRGLEARGLTAMMLNSMMRESATARSVSERPRVLVILTADPLWVAGPGTFIDELVTMAGAVNVAHGTASGYHAFSPERVVAAKPNIILVLGPRTDVAKVTSRRGWAHLPAVERHAVYQGDPDTLTRPGPRLTQALASLLVLFHPRLARHP